MDGTRLETMIKESGYKKQYIAERLGITSTGLNYKLQGKTDFKLREAIMIKMLLNMPDKVFFDVFI